MDYRAAGCRTTPHPCRDRACPVRKRRKRDTDACCGHGTPCPYRRQRIGAEPPPSSYNQFTVING